MPTENKLKPAKTVYDPVNKVTHAWDSRGIYQGPSDESFNTPFGKLSSEGEQIGDTDWGAFARDAASDVASTGIALATPEFKALSPLKAILAKMGINFAGGTVADQAINYGQDKPLINSAVDSGFNTLTGIGIPEALFNLRLGAKGITRRSITERSNSGSNTTEHSSSSSSQPLTEIQHQYVPGKGPQGQILFGKNVPVKVPIPGTIETSTSGTSTTSGGGRGISNTTREVGTAGWLGHLLELAKSIESTNAKRLTPLQSALAGLGLNVAADGTINRSTK